MHIADEFEALDEMTGPMSEHETAECARLFRVEIAKVKVKASNLMEQLQCEFEDALDYVKSLKSEDEDDIKHIEVADKAFQESQGMMQKVIEMQMS